MRTTRTTTPFARRLRASVAGLALVATGALATGCGAGSPDRPAAATEVPAAVEHASVVVRPLGAIQVHERPDAASPSRSVPGRTGFGSQTALLVTAQRGDWVQVLVPGRPTGATGWLPVAEAGQTQAITTEIRVDLAARELTYLEDGEEVLRTPVAVGAPGSPTPTGRFSVTDKLDTQDPSGAYGQYAFGLSGRSEVLTEFAGGDGQIGIHGTDDPASFGRPVSHGCIRVPDEVMARLNAVLPLGTPVVVS